MKIERSEGSLLEKHILKPGNWSWKYAIHTCTPIIVKLFHALQPHVNRLFFELERKRLLFEMSQNLTKCLNAFPRLIPGQEEARYHHSGDATSRVSIQ